ncbi:MAG: PD-(D/E)XK nuclease family protein [Chitinophagaceae bacterium]
MEDDNSKQLDNLFGASPPRELKLSYSRISDFYKNGPQALIRRSDIDNERVRVGSLVDDLLYTKLVDSSHFNQLYYMYDGEKPSATLGKLINVILETSNQVPTKEEVLQIVKKNSFWSNIVNETTLNGKFSNKQFWDYLNAYYNSKDKVIVGTDDYARAEEMVNILLTHQYSKYLFKESNTRVMLYQYPVKFDYDGFIIRGILDFLEINHKDKTVRPIDLKTGRDEPEFFTSSFIKLRYDLQEAVYTLAFEHICKELKLEGYTLLPFQFLYISRYEKTPVIYEVPEKWHIAAKKGYSLNGRHIKGLFELIDDIKWHWDNKIFDKSRAVCDNKGRLVLDDSFITVN